MTAVTLIDNYDSFTWNLVHYFGSLGAQVDVRRNDEVTVAQVMESRPEAIVLSPGPCTPREAGVCLDLIAAASRTFPIFGVGFVDLVHPPSRTRRRAGSTQGRWPLPRRCPSTAKWRPSRIMAPACFAD